MQNLIIDNSNLFASIKVYFQVHHAMVEDVVSALYAPNGRLQIMVFKNLEFFWNGRFEETGSTSLFLTVWETGYAEAHAGPFTSEDLNSGIRFAQF